MIITNITDGYFNKREDGYYTCCVNVINDEGLKLNLLFRKLQLTLKQQEINSEVVLSLTALPEDKDADKNSLIVLIADNGEKNGTN